ncbi:MAG: NADH-quinone oxidoreductase subunit [Planctomycetota bacterium]
MTDASQQLYNYLAVGGIVFTLGLIGFVVRRNLIVMFLCAEMMLQGVSLSLIGWGRYHDDWGGQMLVIFIIAVAACEAGIALALVVMLFQKSEKLDITFWQSMREEGRNAFVDRQVPVERDAERSWPHLTPAGIQPVVDEEAQLHRSRV